MHFQVYPKYFTTMEDTNNIETNYISKILSSSSSINLTQKKMRHNKIKELKLKMFKRSKNMGKTY